MGVLGMMVILNGLLNIRKKLDMLLTVKLMVYSSCHGTNMLPISGEYQFLFINHMVDMLRNLSPSPEELCATTSKIQQNKKCMSKLKVLMQETYQELAPTLRGSQN